MVWSAFKCTEAKASDEPHLRHNEQEQQGKHRSRQRRHQNGQQHRRLRMGRAEAGNVHGPQDEAAEQRSHHHDAFQGDVDNAAALREHAPQRDQQQGYGKNDGSAQNIGYDFHAFWASCSMDLAWVACSCLSAMPPPFGRNSFPIRLRMSSAKAAR